MSTETHDLTFSDEIADMAAEALRGYAIAESDLIDAGSEVLQAAGPALIAAAYRQIADELDRARKAGPAGVGVGIDLLRRRADQLDA